eukprot:3923358-Rhodomonas_salina.2
MMSKHPWHKHSSLPVEVCVQDLLCSESQRELGVRGPWFEMRQVLHRDLPWVGGEATLTRRQSARWRREGSLSGCGTRRHGGANGHARWHRSESSYVRVAIRVAAAASELSLCRQALSRPGPPQ